MILIALDYDGTYTASPELWDDFIKSSLSRGYEIICVTMRFPHEAGDCNPNKLGIPIIYTGREAKAPFLKNNHGLTPTIWIDDNPAWIYQDAF